ncbi:hypothetical protein FBQ82_01835 [Anaerolineae bacterium CFX7]|nr:hypothetical protein [Anaerolineae bacterium CFX7]
MCCLLTVFLFLGPRAALALWWLADMGRFNIVYNTFIMPFLGFLFLPFTTIMYTLVWQPNGIEGFNWVWLGLAVVLDIASYTGGGYGNRNRIPGYKK